MRLFLITDFFILQNKKENMERKEQNIYGTTTV